MMAKPLSRSPMRLACFWILMLIMLGCEKDPDLFDPGFEVYALLPAEGMGDRSFVDVVYQGIEECRYQYDFIIRYILPDSLEAGVAWIARIPELQGTSGLPVLIIIAGNQYRDAVEALNGNFGNHKVLLLAGAASEQAGLASITYRSYAASYIGGHLSASLVTGCRAMVVAGFNASFLREFSDGFAQGVTDAGGIVYSPAYLATGFEGFAMPDSAYRLTLSLLPENDLLFALGDGSNYGIINAARDYPEPRYVIGVDADQSWMGLKVVTGSVMILYGKEIFEYISEFSEGRFAMGHFTRTMEDGKTIFHINKLVLGDITIPNDLIQTAIKKENAWIGNNGRWISPTT